MSWPTDGEPRFAVASVTGYSISATMSRRSGSAKPYTMWNVLDRADCHRVVWMQHAKDRHYGPGGAEVYAREQAARFELECAP